MKEGEKGVMLSEAGWIEKHEQERWPRQRCTWQNRLRLLLPKFRFQE